MRAQGAFCLSVRLHRHSDFTSLIRQRKRSWTQTAEISRFNVLCLTCPTKTPAITRDYTSGKLLPEAPNYDEAKALLTKAGYPDGFNLMLAGPAGLYPGDAESLQAIAQSWARIGVTTQPSAAPFSVFNTKRAAGDHGIWYGGTSGEAVDIILRALLASPNPERGTGALNFGKYRNEAFDAKLAHAESIAVGPERAEATELVMADQPIIPLYHFHHIVGYGPRIDAYVMHPRGWTTAMQTLAATE